MIDVFTGWVAYWRDMVLLALFALMGWTWPETVTP